MDSALRELKEELGVTAQPQDLILCGQRSFQFSAVFHGKPFKDNQVSNVYLLWLDRDAEEFTLQKEEISACLLYTSHDRELENRAWHGVGYLTWRETGSSVQERVTERLETIELNKIAAKREKTLKNEHLREGV